MKPIYENGYVESKGMVFDMARHRFYRWAYVFLIYAFLFGKGSFVDTDEKVATASHIQNVVK